MDTKTSMKILFEVLFVMMIIQTNNVESRKLAFEESVSPQSSPEESDLVDKSDLFCDTGVLDLISKDVCCPLHCVNPETGKQTCGGEKCEELGLAEECCTSEVRKLERYCDEVSPPCVIKQPQFINTTDEFCSGGILDEKNKVCCMPHCKDESGNPFCGGVGCGLSTLGESQGCCVTEIRENTRYCDEVGPPCVIRTDALESQSSDDDWLDDNKEWFYPVVVVSGSILLTIVVVLLVALFKK